jgi:hypothetical protein
MATISLIEEGNINRDRIVNGHLVPDEYFCPICQYLLWKPRSCSSCQHLFCQKCIQNTNKCPFRCQSFEERRCPPCVQSLLSRLNIHCRNSSFGCTAVVSYDTLEYHETVECEYLSQVEKLNEHRDVPELCIPCPIKCNICENDIDKLLFREHFHHCCEERMNESVAKATLDRNLQRILNGEGVRKNVTNTLELVERQKQFSELTTNLKEVDGVRHAQK